LLGKIEHIPLRDIDNLGGEIRSVVSRRQERLSYTNSRLQSYK